MGSDFFDKFVTIMSQLDTLSDEGIDYDGLNLYSEFNNTPDSDVQLNIPTDHTSLPKIEHNIVKPLSVKRDHISMNNVTINTNINDFRINFETFMRNYVREWFKSLKVKGSFESEASSQPIDSNTIDLDIHLQSEQNKNTKKDDDSLTNVSLYSDSSSTINDDVSMSTIKSLPASNNPIVHNSIDQPFNINKETEIIQNSLGRDDNILDRDREIQNSKKSQPSQQENPISDTKPKTDCSPTISKITNTEQEPSSTEDNIAIYKTTGPLKIIAEDINCVKNVTVTEQNSHESSIGFQKGLSTDTLNDTLKLVPMDNNSDIDLQYSLNVNQEENTEPYYKDSMNETIQFIPKKETSLNIQPKSSSKQLIERRDIRFENLDNSHQNKRLLKAKSKPANSSKPSGKNNYSKKSTTLKPIFNPNNKPKVKLLKQLGKKKDYLDKVTSVKELGKIIIIPTANKLKTKSSVLKQSKSDNAMQEISNDLAIPNTKNSRKQLDKNQDYLDIVTPLKELDKSTIQTANKLKTKTPVLKQSKSDNVMKVTSNDLQIPKSKNSTTGKKETQKCNSQAKQFVNDNHLKDLIQHVMSSEALTKQHKSTMEHIEHVNDTLLKTAEQISDYRLNNRDMFTDVNEQTKILRQNQQTLQDTIQELQNVFSINENVDKLKKSQETKKENDLEWAKLQSQIQSSQMDHDLRINQIQSSIAAAEIKANSHAHNVSMQYQLGMGKLKLEEWKADLQNTLQKESNYKNHEHQFQLVKIQSEIETDKQKRKDWYTAQENERERLFKKQLHDQKLQQEIEKLEHETRLKEREKKFTKDLQKMKDEHAFFMEEKKQERAMQIEYDKLKSSHLLAEQSDNIERYKADLLAHVKNRQIDKQDENEKFKLQFKLSEQERKNSSCKYQFRVVPLAITSFEYQIQKSSESASFSIIQTFEQLWNTQYESTINQKRLLKYKRELETISKKAVDNYVHFISYLSQDITSGVLSRRLEYCNFFNRPGMFLYKTSIPYEFKKYPLNDLQKQYLQELFINKGESVGLSIPRFIVTDDGNFITDLLEYMEKQLTFPVNAVYNINLSYNDKICYQNRIFKCKEFIRAVLYNYPLSNTNTNNTCTKVQTNNNESLKKPRRSVPIYVSDNRIVVPSLRNAFLWKERTRNPSYF